MHRNAEIWAERSRKLDRMLERGERNFSQALDGAKNPVDSSLIRLRLGAWRERMFAVQNRVWHARCIAKGWRKA